MAKIRISRRKEYREQLRMFITLTKPLNADIKRSFKKFGTRASKEYTDNEFISNEFYDDLFFDLYGVMVKSADNVIDSVYKRFKRTREMKALEETSPFIQEYVTGQTAQNVANISATTQKYIQSAIAYSISEGLGVIDTAYQIERSTAFSPTRAKLIARTEVHQAMNYGSFRTAKSLLLTEPIKEWGSALDVRSRPWHRDMNGKKVRLDEDFVVFTPTAGGGVAERRMKYCGDANGGASNVINCRCFTIYGERSDIIED